MLSRFLIASSLCLLTSLAACQKAPRYGDAQVARVHGIVAWGERERARIEREGTVVTIAGRNFGVARSGEGKAIVSHLDVGPLDPAVADISEAKLAVDRVTGCYAYTKFYPRKPGAFVPKPGGFKGPTVFDLDCTRGSGQSLWNSQQTSGVPRASLPFYPKANATFLSYSPEHGYQVNYLGPNGRSALWYPGNVRAVTETWRVEDERICFRHPSSTYNPVTGNVGGNFECTPLALQRSLVVAQLDGDPFGLSSGAVPYPRGKCDAPSAFVFSRKAIRCDLG